MSKSMPLNQALKAFWSRVSVVPQIVAGSAMPMGWPKMKFCICGLVGVQPPIGAKKVKAGMLFWVCWFVIRPR